MDEIIEEIANKAKSYVALDSDYGTLVSQVIQMGGKAMMTKSLSLHQAEQITSMMLAAVILAKTK